MKTISCVSGGLLAAWAVAQLSAQAEAPGWSLDPNRLGVSQRVSTLLGHGIQDQHGKKIGSISDFLLDLPNGQVLCALVTAKDPTRVIPVPTTTYSFTIGKRVEVGVPRDQFLAAPELPKPQPGATPEPSQLAPSYRHFRCAEPAAAGSSLVSAASLIGASVSGTTGEPLGKVTELLADLQRGQILYVVIDPTPGERPGPKLYVVPPLIVRMAGAHRVTLPLTRAEFMAGPNYQTEFSVDIISPSLAANVRAHFHLPAPAAGPHLDGNPAPVSPAGGSNRELTQVTGQTR